MPVTQGVEPASRPSSNVSHASLRTDHLALARAEIKSLKQERDTLRNRLERVLGDEIREIDRSQLTDRITELERLLQTAQNELADAAKTINAHRTESRALRTARCRSHPQSDPHPPGQRSINGDLSSCTDQTGGTCPVGLPDIGVGEGRVFR